MIRESGNYRLVILTPDYSPPDTLSKNLNRQLQSVESLEPTHIAVVDKDVVLPQGFYGLPEKYPEADIIGVHVVPSNLVFRYWEKLTFWARLEDRIRDCAVIYAFDFLMEQLGFPVSTTPGTILRRATSRIVVAELEAVHVQPFNLSHSITIQVRDGPSRAEMHYSFWKTLFHSIVRLRPLVFTAYLFYRYRGQRIEFGHPW